MAKNSSSEYKAVAVMSIQCLDCDEPHEIQHQLEAPILFLKSLSKCKICNSSLEVCDEVIEYADSTDGNPNIHVQAKLVCNQCSISLIENKNISSPDLATLKSAKSIDIDIAQEVIAPHEHLAPPIKNPSRFKVALSFPVKKRDFVKGVADELCEIYSKDAVFFYENYLEELARPNLDLYLQKIYSSDSQLIVVFLCEAYEKGEWCGLEWRVIREMIKNKRGSNIMLMRFDDTEIPGLLELDGFINLSAYSPEIAADLIRKRIEFESR
jgi:hypothetical protein